MEKKTGGRKSKIAKTIEKIFNLFIFRSLIFDVLIFFVGLFFIINPYFGLRGCEIAFSVVIILSGIASLYDCTARKIINLFNFSLIYGVLSLIFGLLIIFNPLSLTNAITICFGIWVTLSGALKISHAIYLKNSAEESWSVVFGIGLISTIVGILVIFNPFIELYITQVVGIFMVLYSILDFTNNILLKKRSKEIVKIFK